MRIYEDLVKHTDEIKKTHLRQLFEADPKRFEKFHAEFDGFLLDYSKNTFCTKALPNRYHYTFRDQTQEI